MIPLSHLRTESNCWHHTVLNEYVDFSNFFSGKSSQLAPCCLGRPLGQIHLLFCINPSHELLQFKKTLSEIFPPHPLKKMEIRCRFHQWRLRNSGTHHSLSWKEVKANLIAKASCMISTRLKHKQLIIAWHIVIVWTLMVVWCSLCHTTRVQCGLALQTRHRERDRVHGHRQV